ncbi:protein of unknown function [Clostridium beijerinckii]|nr:protein of unknown function [Clostridium beijerinckii]
MLYMILFMKCAKMKQDMVKHLKAYLIDTLANNIITRLRFNLKECVFCGKN